MLENMQFVKEMANQSQASARSVRFNSDISPVSSPMSDTRAIIGFRNRKKVSRNKFNDNHCRTLMRYSPNQF